MMIQKCVEIPRRERIINKTGVWNMCVLYVICINLVYNKWQILLYEKMNFKRLYEELNGDVKIVRSVGGMLWNTKDSGIV